MAQRRTEDRAALGPASMAMATLGLWILDLATKRRDEARTSLSEWRGTNRESPSGLCLMAAITWFVAMAVPAAAIVFAFAWLEAGGVDLRWWGWLPAMFLSAAVAGFAVNGLRELLSDDATPTLAADVLIGMLVLASTITIFGLQQMSFG